MSEKTAMTNPSEEEQGNTPPVLSHVLAKDPLTPQEIERMCKAFIRLIIAEEITPHDTPTPERPRSIKTAARYRKRRNVHTSSTTEATPERRHSIG